MTKPKRLGRGLEALLSRTPQRVEPPIQVPVAKPGALSGAKLHHEDADPAADETYGDGVAAYQADAEPPTASPQDSAHDAPGREAASRSPAPNGPLRLAIGLIDSNPYQPRQDFDKAEMRSLTESLQDHGLLQPVVVRRTGDRYQLIAGERRLRAAEMAGWTDVPAQVVEADDRQVAELAIVENLQRKDLNPLEKAASFQRYLEAYGCTQDELAGRLKLDRSTISNLIRLLELPEAIQAAVRQGRVSQGHARALLPIGDEREQVALAERIEREGWSVRQTETVVQEMIDASDRPALTVIGVDGRPAGRSRRPQSEHVAALEQEFRAALGTKVKLTHNSRGRGRLVIQFRNHEEFERVRQAICEPGEPGKRGQVG